MISELSFVALGLGMICMIQDIVCWQIPSSMYLQKIICHLLQVPRYLHNCLRLGLGGCLSGNDHPKRATAKSTKISRKVQSNPLRLLGRDRQSTQSAPHGTWGERELAAFFWGAHCLSWYSLQMSYTFASYLREVELTLKTSESFPAFIYSGAPHWWTFS